MNKWLKILIALALIPVGASFLLAAPMGDGTEIFNGRNVGLGTSTPQGAWVVTNGNVGIGTWAPVNALDVAGDINATGMFWISGVADGWRRRPGTISLTSPSNNVGIGTTAPQAPLVVLGAMGIGTWTGGAHPLLTIMNGNVGIGTSVPESTLVVNGIIDLSASNTVTSNPTFTPQSNNGWKLCMTAGQCWGTNTGEMVMQISATGWLSLFGVSLPLTTATAGKPDSNAIAAFSGAGNGTAFFKGNVGIGTWLAGNNKFSVVGNVGVGTNSASPYIYNRAPAGGVILEGNLGIGTATPGAALTVVGSVGIGTWTAQPGAGVSITNGNVGIGTVRPQDKLIVVGGNVGIGTWLPQNALIIQGGNIGIGTPAANRAYLEVVSTTNDYNGKATMWVENSSQNAVFALDNTAVTTPGHQWELWATNSSRGFVMRDGSSGRSPLTISTSGLVGVGTFVSPNAFPISLAVGFSTGGIGLGTNASSAYVSTKSPAGGMNTEGNVGVGTYYSANALDVNGAVAVGAYAGINAAPANGAIVSGNVGVGTGAAQTALAVPGNVGIGTWTANARLIVAGGGNVGIGTYTPQALLAVVGGNVGIGTWTAAHFLEMGADSAAKPGGGTWTSTSDARLKKAVVPITDAIERLSQLRGVRFTWVNPSLHGGRSESAGFVAQDVARVFPEFVTRSRCRGQDCALTGGDDVYSVSLPFTFDAYVVEALKDLHCQDEAMSARVQALEKKIRHE